MLKIVNVSLLRIEKSTNTYQVLRDIVPYACLITILRLLRLYRFMSIRKNKNSYVVTVSTKWAPRVSKKFATLKEAKLFEEFERERISQIKLNSIFGYEACKNPIIDEFDPETAEQILDKIKNEEKRLIKLEKKENEHTEHSRALVKSLYKLLFDISIHWPKNENFHPAIPSPFLTPSIEAIDIPDLPGVYFFWESEEIVYVGKSISLHNRLKLGLHHILKANMKISFVILDKNLISLTEHYYIATLCPKYNFGGRFYKKNIVLLSNNGEQWKQSQNMK